MTRRQKLIIILPLSFCLLLYCVVLFLQNAGFRFVYQESISMPIGYYWIYPSSDYQLNDFVLFRPTKATTDFLLNRGYLQNKKPLLKEIKGIMGDRICYKQNEVTINNSKNYPIYTVDKKGRSLPKVSFCSKLKKDEYFVIGISSPYSFDSRYFGIIHQNQILGKAIRL